jgi:CCR4-NOT transcriptional regulation complex NOT5 subunit
MSKKPTRVSTENLEQLRARLEALPPKPKTDHSRQETVEMLQAQIRHAVNELGYSFADVAAFYRDLGTEISPSSIASMLRALSPKASGKKTAPKQRKANVRKKDHALLPPSQPAFADPQDLTPYVGLPDEDEDLFQHIADTGQSSDLR